LFRRDSRFDNGAVSTGIIKSAEQTGARESRREIRRSTNPRRLAPPIEIIRRFERETRRNRGTKPLIFPEVMAVARFGKFVSELGETPRRGISGAEGSFTSLKGTTFLYRPKVQNLLSASVLRHGISLEVSNERRIHSRR